MSYALIVLVLGSVYRALEACGIKQAAGAGSVQNAHPIS
jgi:hypothetical protein